MEIAPLSSIIAHRVSVVMFEKKRVSLSLSLSLVQQSQTIREIRSIERLNFFLSLIPSPKRRKGYPFTNDFLKKKNTIPSTQQFYIYPSFKISVLFFGSILTLETTLDAISKKTSCSKLVLDSKNTGGAQRSMVDRFADFSTPPSRATLSRFVSQVPRRMKASRHRGWGEAGGGGGRSVTVFHAGRGRRTPKIGACARACMSVQDARRCSRYTPTSLCSPVTFAEAVFSPSPPLPSPSSTASSLLPSRRYPPIPLLFSSLLFFFPLALFPTLLLLLSSALATRFEDSSVSRFNRKTEREWRVFREGIFWLGVQCIQVQCIRAGCVGLLAHFFARNPCNRFSSSSFLLFFYLVSSVLEIFTGFTRYREKSWQGFFEGWGRGLKERLVVFEDWVVEGIEGFLTRVFEIRLDFLLSKKKFEISNKYWEYLDDVFERISFCRVFRENSGERYGNQFADASVR